MKVLLTGAAGQLGQALIASAPEGIELVATGRQELCLLYTSPSPRDYAASRMPSSA